MSLLCFERECVDDLEISQGHEPDVPSELHKGFLRQNKNSHNFNRTVFLLQNKSGLHYVTVVFLIYKNDVNGKTNMFNIRFNNTFHLIVRMEN